MYAEVSSGEEEFGCFSFEQSYLPTKVLMFNFSFFRASVKIYGESKYGTVVKH